MKGRNMIRIKDTSDEYGGDCEYSCLKCLLDDTSELLLKL